MSVPALVHETVFALAQEQLQRKQKLFPATDKRASLLQGLLVCQQRGYAMYGLLEENLRTGCITSDARVQMDIVGHRAHGARTVQFGRIT